MIFFGGRGGKRVSGLGCWSSVDGVGVGVGVWSVECVGVGVIGKGKRGRGKGEEGRGIDVGVKGVGWKIRGEDGGKGG